MSVKLYPTSVGVPVNTVLPADNFEVASIHPIIRSLCKQFRDGEYALLMRQKIKNRKDQDRIAHAFFAGAYETQYYLAGGIGANAYTLDGSLNPDDAMGAIALFLGGNMYRLGAMGAVRGVWEAMGES